jgi:hypothetical protein
MNKVVISLVVFVIIGLGFVAGGAYQIYKQKTGTPARATVSRCDTGRRSNVCRGSWTTGSLLAGGRVTLGIVEGASSGDVGKTLDVRVDGERAYVPSLRVPIIFFVLGAAFLIGGPLSLRRRPAR